MAFLFSSFVFMTSVVAMLMYPNNRRNGGFILIAIAIVATCITWLAYGELAVLLGIGSLCIHLVVHRLLRNFSSAGIALLTSQCVLVCVGLLWAFQFIHHMPVSTVTKGLLLVGLSLLSSTVPSKLLQTFLQYEVLCRNKWLRPRAVDGMSSNEQVPFVSLHVPCYAEPPDIVIDTLNALAQLEYPHFEVLVVDNNTRDEALWRPIEAHCKKLGAHFRFFHVSPLAGAKAGALNFALTHTSLQATIVGVVDSDYRVIPSFLQSLVGFFNDPQIGFVQTSHDYRAWEGKLYQRMCYYEYKIFYQTAMVSFNERSAAITVGTMCLIRKKALEEAGRWSEWCVTEDSELAIRIHACGYSSLYLGETFGRGLIPETFAGYKKQRFRWTYGPIQELKEHLTFFLPAPFRRPSRLSGVQRLFHFNHGLENWVPAFEFLLAPLGIATILSMVVHGEIIVVPLELWISSTIILIMNFVLTFTTYRRIMECSFFDTVGALIASKALSYTRIMAGLRGFVTTRIPWKRTSKFKAMPSGLSALLSARGELTLGICSLIFAVISFLFLPKEGLLLMLLIGVLFKSIHYFCAPLMAFLAERGIRHA